MNAQDVGALFDMPIEELVKRYQALTARPKITFRGWPGHYILGDRCRFRLNTLIEHGEVRVVVSTVGLLPNWYDNGATPQQPNGYDTIGHNRFFETMVFRARQDELGYWDAAVDRGQIDHKGRATYQSPDNEALANAGHYTIIDEICERMVAGETFIPDATGGDS